MEVISDQKKNAEKDGEKMRQMHMIKQMGLDIKKDLEKGDTLKFGRWLNAHWETKKKFSKKMSSNEIDDYYELGLKNGAIGGKLVGAGGGGFLLFYCENKKKQLREAMLEAGLRELPFRFDQEGAKIIYQGR
jgi:D-glycero-alpha-D-manno-heptose-7-phosphate kinase